MPLLGGGLVTGGGLVVPGSGFVPGSSPVGAHAGRGLSEVPSSGLHWSTGFGAMPDYSAQVTTQDRWATAAYIRVLQLSQNAGAADTQGLDMNAKPLLDTTPGSGATLPKEGRPAGENKK